MSKKEFARPATGRVMVKPARPRRCFGRHIPGSAPEGRPGMTFGSVDQAIEFGGVLAGDLVHDLGREAGELLLDVF